MPEKIQARTSLVFPNLKFEKKPPPQTWERVQTVSRKPGHILYIISICLNVSYCCTKVLSLSDLRLEAIGISTSAYIQRDPVFTILLLSLYYRLFSIYRKFSCICHELNMKLGGDSQNLLGNL